MWIFLRAILTSLTGLGQLLEMITGHMLRLPLERQLQQRLAYAKLRIPCKA